MNKTANSVHKLIWISMILVSLIVLAVFGYKIILYLYGLSKEKEEYGNLSDKYVKEVQLQTDGNEVSDKPPEVDFKSLSEINSDIIGWIYCEGTELNYPIVKSRDNQEYLHITAEGKTNSAGAIFMDCNNSSDFSDYKTIIYGHSMKTGDMFGSLKKYKNKEYYEEHPFLWIITPKKNYKIDLIAGYVTDSKSDIYNMEDTESDTWEFIEKALSKSTFKSKYDIGESDRVVVLSTCTYEFDNARYVILGKFELDFTTDK